MTFSFNFALKADMNIGVIPCLFSLAGIYNGYAGGLGPGNVLDELTRIATACGDCRAWIDMETKLYTGGKFDLSKCRQVLEQVAPQIQSSQER